MANNVWQIAPGSIVPNLKLLKVVMKLLKTLNVGIDKSQKRSSDFPPHLGGKVSGKSFKISNNVPGVKELEDRLLNILSPGTFEHIHFAMETTQHYGLN